MTTTIEVRSADSLEEAMIRTYRAGLIRIGWSVDEATKHVAKGTDVQIRFRTVAEQMSAVFYNERALEDAQMSDTATGEDLERRCEIKGIERSQGSGAAGDVIVTCAGTCTYAAGQELVSATNGKRYRVVATSTVFTGSNVGIVGVDIGKSTNLKTGEILTWVSPPGASAPTCVVSITGIVNGQDADNDARLRARLQKVEQNPPGAGNWSQLRQWAEGASASVQDAYAYPAVHGPGTAHVAITVEGTAENGYVREAPAALVAVVRDSVLAEYPDPADVIVTTVANSFATLALKMTLPEPLSVGGPGGGWLDAVRWPPANVGGSVVVTAVTNARTFVVNATTAPVVGRRVALWVLADATFLRGTIASFFGTSGAYTIVLDVALPSVTVGSYVSPDAERLTDYGRALCEEFAKLGPGQRDGSGDPRRRRHPVVSAERPSQISQAMVARVQARFLEIAAARFYIINGAIDPTGPISPHTAFALNQAPRIFRVGQIGIYP